MNEMYITPVLPSSDSVLSSLLPTATAMRPISQCNDQLSPLLSSTKPRSTSAFTEAKSILAIALPMAATGLLLYSRSMLSMFFLGRLGRLPLAGGALAIGFANITGYSVLSGLAAGMEPICGQAFGARNSSLPSHALRRTVLLLLAASLPIALLWSRIRPILLLFGQDPDISKSAETYLLSSLPDLILHSLLHPLRIFLRTQSITTPLTLSAAAALLLHLPINYLLVSHFHLGVPGVALASLWSNFNLVALLLIYVSYSGIYHRDNTGSTQDVHVVSWASLLNLSLPSCVSVCLEWWWYEIMILLCGLLLDPKSTVASMGILIQTTSLIYIFPSSLSFGVSTRVGNELGANRPDRARRAASVGLACGLAAGLAAAGFAASVRNVWAGVFTGDDGIVKLTASVLPVLGLCELGNCPQTTGCGVLRGSARPRVGANINLGSFYGVGMPVAMGLAFWGGMDFQGLWLGLLAAQATCAVLMLGVVRRTDWDVQAERARRLTGAGDEEVKGPAESRAGDGDDKDSSLTLTSIKIQTN